MIDMRRLRTFDAPQTRNIESIVEADAHGDCPHAQDVARLNGYVGTYVPYFVLEGLVCCVSRRSGASTCRATTANNP